MNHWIDAEMEDLTKCYADLLAACAEIRAIRAEMESSPDPGRRGNLALEYSRAFAEWRSTFQEFSASVRRLARRANPGAESGFEPGPEELATPAPTARREGS